MDAMPPARTWDSRAYLRRSVPLLLRSKEAVRLLPVETLERSALRHKVARRAPALLPIPARDDRESFHRVRPSERFLRPALKADRTASQLAEQVRNLSCTLHCRICERLTILAAACPRCRGPLDAAYDWDAITVSRNSIGAGPDSLWRYGSLLPISEREPHAGWTPIVEAPVLAAQLGLSELWLKLETAHIPQQDARMRAVATAAAKTFGLDVGNDWLRLAPYAAEGPKTVAFEIVEQLGWRFPCAVIAPVATGRLLIKLGQGFDELERVGLLGGSRPRLLGALPTGTAFRGMDGELAEATAAAVNGKIVDVPPPGGVRALLQIVSDEARAGAFASSHVVVLVVAGDGPATAREVELLLNLIDLEL